MNKIKILNIVGARPNLMKIAPLMRVMQQDEEITPKLIHTGQHYDENLSKVFFDQLGIPRPDVNLEVGSGSREEQISLVMERFEPVVKEERPDLVLVVGDVNSTIACAKVAKRFGVRVAHVEAGLRSFDPNMPEEHNRVQTDQISDYLFVTEPSGVENLKDEKIEGTAFFVGNVMIDTLIANLEKAKSSTVIGDLSLTPKEYFVGTFHRPSNVDQEESLRRLCETIAEICTIAPMVLPLHPRTRGSLEEKGMLAAFRETPGLQLTEPLGYLDFLALVKGSKGVVTDSGGLQEETTYLQVPCITMRENTERPVTIEVGSNVLTGGDRGLIRAAVQRIMSGDCRKGEIPKLWDGRAAERIVAILKKELGE